MYTFIIHNNIIAIYKSIRDLYHDNFHVIVVNFNFQLFFKVLEEFGISDHLDSDGLIIGAIRNNIIIEDEIELLEDDELFLLLNKCLINGFKIQQEN